MNNEVANLLFWGNCCGDSDSAFMPAVAMWGSAATESAVTLPMILDLIWTLCVAPVGTADSGEDERCSEGKPNGIPG